LADQLQDQEFKDQAAKEIQNLAQSLQNRSPSSQQTAKAGEVKEPAEKNGELVAAGEESDRDEADNAQTEGASGASAAVQEPDRPRKDAPREGPPTEKLDV